jgi:Chaperone of endosialidase
MNRVWGKAVGIAGLILMLGGTSSWGAPPNNDASDAVGNTAGGTAALANTTTGVFNTADGFAALFSNTTGSVNTAVGIDVLLSNTTGNNNTGTGAFALFRTTTGGNNTASGVDTLFNNTTGSSNTGTGAFALFSTTTGGSNTGVGVNALFSTTAGSSNTGVGVNALFSTTAGDNNLAVGAGAGGILTSGSNNIYLGNSGGTGTESNTMRLGQVQTQTFIAGIAGVPVSGSAVLISSTGQLGVQASSARYKYDIQPMGAHSRGLLQLRPVIFRYKHDAQGERQYGLIAEDVAKVYPELVTRGATGDIEAVRYHEVIPMLLNEMQHQQRQLATQAQELAALKAQNARLRAAVVHQQERDAALAARLERLEAAAARAAALASR